MIRIDELRGLPLWIDLDGVHQLACWRHRRQLERRARVLRPRAVRHAMRRPDSPRRSICEVHG